MTIDQTRQPSRWIVPLETPPVVAGYTPIFAPYLRVGDHVSLSGRLGKRAGQVLAGRVGGEIDLPSAAESARGIALELLACLRDAAGTLDEVASLGRLLVMVRVADDFTQPHVVANALSEVFLEVLGERGRHARSAVGVSQLPFGACVEAELTAHLRNTGA